VGLNRKAEEGIPGVKEEIYKKLVLAALDLDKKIRMEVDILDYVIGEVLSMKCEDGK